MSQAWPLAAETGLPTQACPDHSPLFSALGFGGSGSGRHGQGPSQRELRLLPVEQAWNSNLHCKRETGQTVKTQLARLLPGFPGSSWHPGFKGSKMEKGEAYPSGFQNTNLGLAFLFFFFFQSVPDNLQTTAEAPGS